MLKWLTSLLVVIGGFLVILLALGYLLKENEAQTTALKQELDQQRAALKEKALKEKTKQANNQKGVFVVEAYQGQINQQEPPERGLPQETEAQNTLLSASITRVVREHASCYSDQQCLLFNFDRQGPGCWLAVNTQGAAILAKITTLHGKAVGSRSLNSCLADKALKAVCRDERCREQVVNSVL